MMIVWLGKRLQSLGYHSSQAAIMLLRAHLRFTQGPNCQGNELQADHAS